KADRFPAPVERESDEMHNLVAATALQGRRLWRQWRIRNRQPRQDERGHSGGKAIGAQKQVEMAVLGGLAVAGRLRRAVRMIEVLAMRLRVVDLALGIASPRSDVAGRPGRLVQDRAVGSRKRVPALAQYRRRNPLPLPQAHPPPWPNWVNERGQDTDGRDDNKAGMPTAHRTASSTV